MSQSFVMKIKTNGRSSVFLPAEGIDLCHCLTVQRPEGTDRTGVLPGTDIRKPFDFRIADRMA